MFRRLTELVELLTLHSRAIDRPSQSPMMKSAVRPPNIDSRQNSPRPGASDRTLTVLVGTFVKTLSPSAASVSAYSTAASCSSLPSFRRVVLTR